VNADWRITSFNRAAAAITGIRRHDAIGRTCSDVFRASMCEADCALRHTVRTGKPIINKSAYIVNATPPHPHLRVHGDPPRRTRRITAARNVPRPELVEELRKELEGRF